MPALHVHIIDARIKQIDGIGAPRYLIDRLIESVARLKRLVRVEILIHLLKRRTLFSC